MSEISSSNIENKPEEIILEKNCSQCNINTENNGKWNNYFFQEDNSEIKLPCSYLSEDDLNSEYQFQSNNLKPPDEESTYFESESYFNDDKDNLNQEKNVRLELKAILEKQMNISNEILKLKHIEEILKCKIKFKEHSNKTVENLQFGNKKDLNTEQNTIPLFRRQCSNVTNEIEELNIQNNDLQTKLQQLMEENNISSTDKDILESTIDLKNNQYELQLKHTAVIVDLYQSELNVKEKFIHLISDMLNTYHKMLLKKGLLNKSKTDTYNSIIRTAQGLGIEYLQLEENNGPVSDEESHDSGISDTNCISTETWMS